MAASSPGRRQRSVNATVGRARRRAPPLTDRLPAVDRRAVRCLTMSSIDTVIIGAGQAGLALSRLLTEAGHDHVVLERGRVGERWRSERWDSLALLTPNWANRLPLRRRAGRSGRVHVALRVRGDAATLRAVVRRSGSRAHDRDRGRTRRGRLPRAHRPRRMAGAQRRGRLGGLRRAGGAVVRHLGAAVGRAAARVVATARRRCWHRAASWSSAPGRAVTRSPTSSRAQGAAWCSPSAVTRASSAATAAATSGPGSTRSASCPGRWTTCRVTRAAGRGPPCRSTAGRAAERSTSACSRRPACA